MCILLRMHAEFICGCVFKHKYMMSLLTSGLRQAIHIFFLTCLLLPTGCRFRGCHVYFWWLNRDLGRAGHGQAPRAEGV